MGRVDKGASRSAFGMWCLLVSRSTSCVDVARQIGTDERCRNPAPGPSRSRAAREPGRTADSSVLYVREVLRPHGNLVNQVERVQTLRTENR